MLYYFTAVWSEAVKEEEHLTSLAVSKINLNIK